LLDVVLQQHCCSFNIDSDATFFFLFGSCLFDAFIKEMLNVAMCRLKKQRKFPHQIMVVVEKVLVVGRVQ